MADHEGRAIPVDLGQLEGADEALAEAVERRSLPGHAARPAEGGEPLRQGVRALPVRSARRDPGEQRPMADRRHVFEEVEPDQL
ncbi:MAG: hypothetical protein K0S81_2664 [Rhodospirillales bacterium]|nr:hypothetical protein [Rhodospirillales bacterium]